MHNPISTYRIQFHKDFTFAHLKQIIPYLHKLGISTIYASPIFRARPGSKHGYDVTDPHEINPEIGTFDELREIAADLKERQMTWVQDIVPNHMAFSHHNPFITDIFEKGPHSKFYTFFDINWNTHIDWLKGKVMTPFLGAELEQVLQEKQLEIKMTEKGFAVAYFENLFPLNISFYRDIISQAYNQQEDNARLKDLKNHFETPDEELANDRKWPQLKEEVIAAYEENKNLFESILKKVNEQELEEVLKDQYFALTYWRRSEQVINYRRFFTINELICVYMREEKVFNYYHTFIKQLYEEQLIQGVRIDHIDGLYDPEIYLPRLRNLLGEDAYIIVEKILEAEEQLHQSWPVNGTTGYDFLSYVNQIFTDEDNKEQLTQIYKKFVPDAREYEDIVFSKKMLVLINYMSGEFDNMLHLLAKLNLIPDGYSNEDLKKFIEAFAVYLVSYPVYRINGNDYPLPEEDIKILEHIFERAEARAPQLQPYFDQLKEIFNLNNEEDPEQYKEKLRFFLRCQQLAVPLTAKGVEDTIFYIYNRLISHNEVGDSPELMAINVKDFHRQMQRRLELMPLTINCTATHDTKRGEDMRMRINVLSELPEIWEKEVFKWRKINKDIKGTITDNDEYFIYQTLIGVLPPDAEVLNEELRERIKQYLVKAVREAKENSDWSNPDKNYEDNLCRFIDDLSERDAFTREYFSFTKKIIQTATYYSLAQVLLKCTVPGIPDIYQGTEFWDLSMVDPDNRRPVNYDERVMVLMKQKEMKDNENQLLQQFTEDITDPAIKMYVTWKCMEQRRLHPEVFLKGEYVPVKMEGQKKEKVVGFIRHHESATFLVLAAHRIADCHIEKGMASGYWDDTEVILPEEFTGSWEKIFSGSAIKAGDSLKLKSCFSKLPLELLKLKKE